MICEHCGSALEPTDVRCHACGHKVGREEPASQKKVYSKSLISDEDIENDLATLNANKTKPEPVADIQTFEQPAEENFTRKNRSNSTDGNYNTDESYVTLKRIAVTSIIFSFLIPIVGLILGIIGKKRSKAYGGKYKKLCSAAIVISLLFIFGIFD